MKFLKQKIPLAFKPKPHHLIQGKAYVDTPLITMSCGMVAQSSFATVDPYALVIQKLSSLEHALKSHGASEVIFVFDGPTRKEKVETCAKRQETIKKQSEKRKRPEIYKEDSEPEIEHWCTPQESPQSSKPNFSIFSDATDAHCLESDLYVSSMIVHGEDTYVLKDLSRFARKYLGERAIQAPHDSESFIAAQVQPGDVGVTCDSDALPFGCEWTVQNIGTSKETWIKLSDILQGLNMTLQEFRVFCVLLGTDFNERLYMCGPAKVFPIISGKRFKGFEEYCMTYGSKYSSSDKLKWIRSAELSLEVFQSEKSNLSRIP